MEEKEVSVTFENNIVEKDLENGKVTTTTAHSNKKEKWKQVLGAFSVCFLCIVAGETLGFTSTAIISMKEDENFPDLTPQEISWIGGLTPLGALSGSILATILIRWFGSKFTILIFASPIFLISHLIIAFSSTSVDMIFVGRFFGGIGIGLTISSSPLYVIEIASDKNRGRLGILPQFLLIFGLWLSNFLGTFLDWKSLSIAFFITALPSIPLLLWAPNPSASHNRKKLNKTIGRLSSNNTLNGGQLLIVTTEKNNFIQDQPTSSCQEEETDDLIMSSSLSSRLKEKGRRTNNNNDDVSNQHISPVLNKENGQEEEEKSPFFGGGRRSKIDMATVKACAVALGLMSFQQLTGINGVAFFAVTIFKQSSSISSEHGGGGHGIDPYLAAIFLISVQLIAVFISTCLVERLGRKILLLVSSSLLSLSAGGLAIYYNFCNHMTTTTTTTTNTIANNSSSSSSHIENELDTCANLYWLPLTFLVSYVFAFAIGYGPISWIILTEILPANVRNLMNPLAIGYSWFCVFLVTTSFPILLIKIELVGIFFLYGGIGVLGFIFILTCVPETKGKSLMEVQAFFGPSS